MVSLEVGIVRLMAGVADHSAGVLGRGHLRETLWLGSILFVALRRQVHAVLARLPEVASFALAGEAGGGWGATVVTLRSVR